MLTLKVLVWLSIGGKMFRWSTEQATTTVGTQEQCSCFPSETLGEPERAHTLYCLELTWDYHLLRQC